MPTTSRGVKKQAEKKPGKNKKPAAALVPTTADRVRTPAALEAADSDGTRAEEAASAAPRDQIERRAYELYEERGKENDRDQDDWLRAERELQKGGRPSA